MSVLSRCFRYLYLGLVATIEHVTDELVLVIESDGVAAVEPSDARRNEG